MFFDKHREKYAKLDSIKSISLEINYFAGTCFKKYTHSFLSGSKSVNNSHPHLFVSFIFICFPLPSLTITA